VQADEADNIAWRGIRLHVQHRREDHVWFKDRWMVASWCDE
jgi:hypothetical protein